jgi:NAD(P)-dependent dehydrogenase (short-subunit alcohol dehydrogenase family)
MAIVEVTVARLKSWDIVLFATRRFHAGQGHRGLATAASPFDPAANAAAVGEPGINIGSINSAYVPYGGGSLYVLTKAAVAGLTKALARDLGPRGITINNVQLGPTDTDMNPASGEFAT